MCTQDKIRVKISLLTDTAVLPQKKSKNSLGYDVFADIPQGAVQIEPHTTQKIKTGLYISVPRGYYLSVCARGKMCSREGLRPAFNVSIVGGEDSELFVYLHNDTDSNKMIMHRAKVAQIMLRKAEIFEIDQVEKK